MIRTGLTLVLGVATPLAAQEVTLQPLRGAVPPPLPPGVFDENDHAPDWSPDGTRILVTRREGHRSYQLYVMRADGSDLRALTTGPGANTQGTYSPDGSRIAFKSTRDGTDELYVMNADGSDPRRLTVNEAYDGERPAWSPDGRRIAFYSDRSGWLDIWTMNADGSDPRPVTNDSAPDYNPQWSPDGTRLVFGSRRGGDREIWSMRADGTDLVQLTHSPGYDGYATWSPDGSRIAFLANRDDQWSIYVMAADGSDQRQLTDAPEWNFDPDWSPDGTRIVFNSRRDGRRGTWIMDADGGHPAKLTNRERSEFVAVARRDGVREAVGRYRRARVALPDTTFFLPVEVQLFGREKMVAGQYAEAALLFEAVIDHHPQYASVMADLRSAYAHLGRPVPPPADSLRAAFAAGGMTEGLTRLAVAAAAFPGQPLLSTGDVDAIAADAIERGRIDNALRIYRLGAAMYPDRVQFYDRMGDLYLQLGDRLSARAALERGRALDPDDVSRVQRLSRLR